MINHAKKNNCKVFVANLPEMDLLNYPIIFKNADNVIKNFFTQFPEVNYYNYRDSINYKNGVQFVLSKYDEHLNEKGHYYLAKSFSNVIINKIISDSLFIKK